MSRLSVLRSAEGLAREHTEAAIETLADVMNDAGSEPRDRIRAAETLLDRGHGKPTSVSIQVPATRRQAERLAAMGDEELERIIREAPIDVPALPAPRRVRADSLDDPDALLL